MENFQWREAHSFSKEEILEAWDNRWTKGFHPIIFISTDTPWGFIGAMITHGQEYETVQNIKMTAFHFLRIDEAGNDYEVYYDASFLVPRRFTKLDEWGPFRKTGQLSNQGISFVESNIFNELPPVTFASYYSDLKREV